MKTSKLTGPALDWAVAKCWWCDPYGSKRIWLVSPETGGLKPHIRILHNTDPGSRMWASSSAWEPSTNWAQGGPFIEREMLAPEPLLDTNCALIKWRCRNWKGDGSDFYGPTPLIAAMRCFVTSKLGDEVDVPEELA